MSFFSRPLKVQSLGLPPKDRAYGLEDLNNGRMRKYLKRKRYMRKSVRTVSTNSVDAIKQATKNSNISIKTPLAVSKTAERTSDKTVQGKFFGFRTKVLKYGVPVLLVLVVLYLVVRLFKGSKSNKLR